MPVPTVKSIEMLPDFADQNIPDSLMGHSEFSGKASMGASSGGVFATNCDDLLVGKFGLGVALAECTPLLFGHVQSIVGLGSEKQMVRTNARRIVASMQYRESIRDWSVVDRPRDTVSALDVSPSSDLELTVSALFERCGPNPTGTKVRSVWRDWSVAIDLQPESFGDGLARVGINTFRHRSISFGVSRPRQFALRGGTRTSQFYPDHMGLI